MIFKKGEKSNKFIKQEIEILEKWNQLRHSKNFN
jgi:hypothetical protein